MTRDAYEDFKRYKADQEINKQKVWVLKKGKFQLTQSGEIQVGDTILIEDGETFPADLVLLASSHTDGNAFIQTSSLDGEKNLKKRSIPKGLSKKFKQGCRDPDTFIQIGVCESEAPSDDLYCYVGKLTVANTIYPLDVNQLLLKGANLKNTPWVVGFCVFTGEDTRLMMNAQDSRVKLSALEKKLNEFVIGMVVLEFCICVAIAIM